MTPIPETYTLVFFALMLFYKMFVEMFICIWISVMCHFSSSVEMQLKKKQKKKKCYFQENSSLKSVDPNCKGGPPEALGQKELNSELNHSPMFH